MSGSKIVLPVLAGWALIAAVVYFLFVAPYLRRKKGFAILENFTVGTDTDQREFDTKRDCIHAPCDQHWRDMKDAIHSGSEGGRAHDFHDHFQQYSECIRGAARCTASSDWPQNATFCAWAEEPTDEQPMGSCQAGCERRSRHQLCDAAQDSDPYGGAETAPAAASDFGLGQRINRLARRRTRSRSQPSSEENRENCHSLARLDRPCPHSCGIAKVGEVTKEGKCLSCRRDDQHRGLQWRWQECVVPTGD